MLQAQTIAAGPQVIAEPSRSPEGLKRFLSQVARFSAVFAFACVSYLFFSRVVVSSVQVSGTSMYPTLKNSDRFLLNKWIFHFRAPRAAEIVVIRDPTDNLLSVKRVVGRPGDTLLFEGGKLYINGVQPKEPYIPAGQVTYPGPTYNAQTIICGPGQYVVLGDNRQGSMDSRVYGAVPKERIVGLLVR